MLNFNEKEIQLVEEVVEIAGNSFEKVIIREIEILSKQAQSMGINVEKRLFEIATQSCRHENAHNETWGDCDLAPKGYHFFAGGFKEYVWDNLVSFLRMRSEDGFGLVLPAIVLKGVMKKNESVRIFVESMISGAVIVSPKLKETFFYKIITMTD